MFLAFKHKHFFSFRQIIYLSILVKGMLCFALRIKKNEKKRNKEI